MVSHPFLKVLILRKQDNINLAQEKVASELNMPIASSSGEDRMPQLAEAVNHLIQTDFNGLVNILYRLDVSEARLKDVLRQQPGADAGKLIASMMVERQLQKMADRGRFPSSKSIPDDEKW
jgi:hypothetical protein